MGNIFTYSGMFAKTKALSGKLLTDEDFQNLAGCANVLEAVQYLKETPGYHDSFQGVSDQPLHRGDIERLLVKGKYQAFESLYRFANESGRQFLKLYFRHYEMDFLKYCLRQLFAGQTKNHHEFELQEFYSRFSKLKIEALLMERDLAGWIALLDNTPYEKAFLPLREQGELTLFDYESALDHYYFLSLLKMKNKLFNNKEGKFLETSLGNQIDLLNIQWIYRSRHKYHLEPQEVRKLLIPLNHRLTDKAIHDLIHSETINDFTAVLATTRYQKLFHNLINENQSLEKLYYYHLIHINKLLSKRSPYSPATLNTYLFLKEEEVRKLTIVIEGLRYQLPAGELLKYIPLKQEVISP